MLPPTKKFGTHHWKYHLKNLFLLSVILTRDVCTHCRKKKIKSETDPDEDFKIMRTLLFWYVLGKNADYYQMWKTGLQCPLKPLGKLKTILMCFELGFF